MSRCRVAVRRLVTLYCQVLRYREQNKELKKVRGYWEIETCRFSYSLVQKLKEHKRPDQAKLKEEVEQLGALLEAREGELKVSRLRRRRSDGDLGLGS